MFSPRTPLRLPGWRSIYYDPLSVPKLQQLSFVICLAFGAVFSAKADTPAFVTIDFPGTTATSVWGINAQGDIVGLYSLADKSAHGFLLSGGRYNPLDYPGASATNTWGMNSKGGCGPVLRRPKAPKGLLPEASVREPRRTQPRRPESEGWDGSRLTTQESPARPEPGGERG